VGDHVRRIRAIEDSSVGGAEPEASASSGEHVLPPLRDG
jgi:hypothetical protein